MKLRIGAAAVLAFVALTACSSSTNGEGNPGSSGPTSPMVTDSGSNPPAPTDTSTGGQGPGVMTSGNDGGSSSAFCTKLKAAETKLSNIGTEMSDPSKLKSVIDEEVSVFSDLSSDAPSEIKPAIEDLANALKAVGKYLDDPASGSPQAMEKLTKSLPQDVQKLETYISANC